MAQGTDPRLSAFFSRPPAQLEDDGWERLELQGGAPLWRQGSQADSLAWVEHGTLRVDADEAERGRIEAGELLGEASAFIPNQPRSADITALVPSRLWVLRRTRLSHLRGNNVEFYDMILRAAIATVARRIVDSDRELRLRHRTNHELPEWTPPTLWARFRRQMVERPDTPPPVADAIAALPKIPPTGVLTSDIGNIAEPLWLKTDEALCLEGDPARSMYVVARGTLMVMLCAGDTTIELSRIGPGALLGTAALLHESERTASLVAAEPTWVYEFARERVDALSAGAWRLLAESLLTVMRDQLIRTHER
ncbi:MAG: cyclic nucleotide-binding domain-containing protein [Myxococcota bacterium]